jgi:hypothetical protein
VTSQEVRRVRRIGPLLALVLLLTAACTRTPDPKPASVPSGFKAWGGGWCAAAFPGDWKQDDSLTVGGGGGGPGTSGPTTFKGTTGWAYVDSSTQLEATRPDEPLPQFASAYAKTQLQVASTQVVDVPGAQNGFRLRLTGADGSTHLLVYGYDAKDQKNCWLGITPADQTAEQIAGTLAVGEG